MFASHSAGSVGAHGQGVTYGDQASSALADLSSHFLRFCADGETLASTASTASMRADLATLGGGVDGTARMAREDSQDADVHLARMAAFSRLHQALKPAHRALLTLKVSSYETRFDGNLQRVFCYSVIFDRRELSASALTAPGLAVLAKLGQTPGIVAVRADLNALEDAALLLAALKAADHEYARITRSGGLSDADRELESRAHARVCSALLASGDALADIDAECPLGNSVALTYAAKCEHIARCFHGWRSCDARISFDGWYDWKFSVGNGRHRTIVSGTVTPGISGDSVGLVSIALRMQLAKALADQADLLRNAQDFVDATLQTMTDDSEVLARLHASLDQPDFASEQLLAVAPAATAGRFIVRFKSDAAWVLSNRGSQKGEFRGEVLKAALQNQRYDCLRDLLMQRYLGPRDSRLQYVLAPLRMDFLRESPACLSADGLIAVLQAAATLPVFDTTLAQMWAGDAQWDAAMQAPLSSPVQADGYVVVHG